MKGAVRRETMRGWSQENDGWAEAGTGPLPWDQARQPTTPIPHPRERVRAVSSDFSEFTSVQVCLSSLVAVVPPSP